MFGRIVSNTRKHILRSGWVGWASVFVMSLAFLVISIFGGLAYVANLQIQYIESKSNMLVFFEVGMDQQIIDDLRNKWSVESKIKDVTYINEEEAYELYSNYTSRVLPEYFAILSQYEEKRLPSSLEIQLFTLDDLDHVHNTLNTDIEAANKSLEIIELEAPAADADEDAEEDEELSEVDALIQSNEDINYRFAGPDGKPPISLEVDDENLERMKDIFQQLRVAGLVVIGLLVVVVAIFIFMTAEFRLYNQKEEIGVMQLVGGSLFFIRSPYILEGGFYGFMGSFVSSLVLLAVLSLVFVVNKTSELSRYIYEEFGQLPWPQIDILGWVIIVILMALVGFLIGTVSSYLSIRRYIR